MVNQKDLKILAYLRQNARMPLTSMSRKTGIPVSTIFDRLKIQEKDLIIKHTAILDFNKLGYSVRANIMLRVSREDRDSLKAYLVKHSSVNSLYRISDGFEIMVEGIFKEIREMEDFIEHLEEKFKITDKKSFFIVEDLKKEGFMDNQLFI